MTALLYSHLLLVSYLTFTYSACTYVGRYMHNVCRYTELRAYVQYALSRDRIVTPYNEQPFGVGANTTPSINRKHMTYRNATRGRSSRHGIGNTHKNFGEDRACTSGDMLANGQNTNAQTDRHAHNNTPPPLPGAE